MFIGNLFLHKVHKWMYDGDDVSAYSHVSSLEQITVKLLLQVNPGRCQVNGHILINYNL
jgi:hypothetical protein